MSNKAGSLQGGSGKPRRDTLPPADCHREPTKSNTTCRGRNAAESCINAPPHYREPRAVLPPTLRLTKTFAHCPHRNAFVDHTLGMAQRSTRLTAQRLTAHSVQHPPWARHSVPHVRRRSVGLHNMCITPSFGDNISFHTFDGVAFGSMQ